MAVVAIKVVMQVVVEEVQTMVKITVMIATVMMMEEAGW